MNALNLAMVNLVVFSSEGQLITQVWLLQASYLYHCLSTLQLNHNKGVDPQPKLMDIICICFFR